MRTTVDIFGSTRVVANCQCTGKEHPLISSVPGAFGILLTCPRCSTGICGATVEDVVITWNKKMWELVSRFSENRDACYLEPDHKEVELYFTLKRMKGLI